MFFGCSINGISKKMPANREIAVQCMVGVVGAQGQLTRGGILCNSGTQYKRPKHIFAVTPIALDSGHTWARLDPTLAV